MIKKILVCVLAIFFLTTGSLAEAQQAKKIPRIGYLSLRSGIEPRDEGFQKGLRELGYIEGQNIVIEWRFAKGNENSLPDLAAELVRLKPDVIVAAGTQAIRTVKQTTSSIPIVFGQVGDPVQLGLVASLAHPGGNLTGVANVSMDLAGKWLELLKEVLPKMSRVAFVRDSRNPGTALALKALEITARQLGVQMQSLEVRSPDDIETAFQAARKGRVQALILMAQGVFGTRQDRARFVDLEIKTKLPVMHSDQQFVIDGGLMSYDTDMREQFRSLATFVDKILKGRKPVDLPVEQPMKFELVINLKNAKQIGVTIPQWTLMKADRVIR